MLSVLSLKKVGLALCVFSQHNKQWKAFHMLLLLCTKQCMGFSTCCHCSLSNISRCSFSCAVKAHLVSSGWISICCHCSFTKQWMWFSTCCHCTLSKSSGFGSRFVFTAHLISGWFSIIFSLLSFRNRWIQFFLFCQGTFSKSWMDFRMLSLLFH